MINLFIKDVPSYIFWWRNEIGTQQHTQCARMNTRWWIIVYNFIHWSSTHDRWKPNNCEWDEENILKYCVRARLMKWNANWKKERKNEIKIKRELVKEEQEEEEEKRADAMELNGGNNYIVSHDFVRSCHNHCVSLMVGWFTVFFLWFGLPAVSRTKNNNDERRKHYKLVIYLIL